MEAPRRFGEAAAPHERAFGHAEPARGGRTFLYSGRPHDVFHVARYDWPHGYHYRPYVVGGRLPRTFWVHEYFISDYATYGVEPPPPGFQWIRYGPDLLLVDLVSGQVANVLSGAFDEGTVTEASE